MYKRQENTHAVLSGHRGLPSKALFTDLDQVQVGDLFSLTVLNETLYYRVDQILTVSPNETDALAFEKGKDYVTLVTCTSDPFLVSIPTVVNGTAAYQVVAEPKFSWDAKPSKPAVPSLKPDPSLPQTGQLNWPIPVLIAMGLSLILLGGWLQRKSDHEK